MVGSVWAEAAIVALVFCLAGPVMDAEKDFELPDGGPVRIVHIPAGPFLMGNNGREPCSYPDELPQHEVYLSGYWIGKYEVTRGQYRGFIDAGGYSKKEYWSEEGWRWKGERAEPGMWREKQVWGPPLEFTQTDDYPVVGVSYYEAEAFCNWAGLELPTEAQWEKAARWDGKRSRTFPWGREWDAEKCNNWYDKLYEGFQSAPVGSYPSGASAYGLMDVAGNAWEWCRDWYAADYYSHEPEGGWVDPRGPATGDCRCMRGGSWFYFDYNTRCAYRGNYFYPSNWYYEYGFRVVRPEAGSAVRVESGEAVEARRATSARLRAPKRSKVGAGAYQGDDPIGGGIGYTGGVNRVGADYVVLWIESIDELKDALSRAKPGEIVYLPNDARIDASKEAEALIIPEGVTIAGGRGEGGSVGPTVFTTDRDRYPLFRTGGPGVRFTGVRIKGPDTEIRGTGDHKLRNAVGVVVNHADTEFDNCEILGWSAAGIQYSDAGQGGNVHHCHIHHNRRAGNGYGVYVHNSQVLITANYFAENRHDIAGSGRAGSSYRACYNISECNEPFTSHAFDMHGNQDSRARGEVVPNIAGDSIVISHNTFRSCRPRIYIAIRGRPRQGVTIHSNVYENAFVAGVFLNPCSNAHVHSDRFTVPAKRSRYEFGADGNIVDGKRVKAGAAT